MSKCSAARASSQALTRDEYLASALHTIRFSSVAMIYFNVVKTKQFEADTETETQGHKTETLKFESRDRDSSLES